MSGRLTDWWRRRGWTKPRISEVSWYQSQAELPDELPRHCLALIGEPDGPKWLVLECPCGHGHRLQVNLSSSRYPLWVVEEEGPSVTPSIDLRGPLRRCHFWLRDGRVYWTRDAGAIHHASAATNDKI